MNKIRFILTTLIIVALLIAGVTCASRWCDGVTEFERGIKLNGGGR